MRYRYPVIAFVLVLGAACSASAPSDPSDDPADYDVGPGSYRPELSAPRWVVPSAGLPEAAKPMASNNNVEVIFFEGRLFMCWRTGPTHFASPLTKMLIVSSGDMGNTWRYEHEIAIKTDVREPRFIAMNGRLLLYYVELGRIPATFTPRGIWRIERLGEGFWSERQHFKTDGDPEVMWRLKKRNGRAWMTSYRGPHYGKGKGTLDVMFRSSKDGLTFSPVGKDGIVYHGGVSEVAFEFAENGDLWAITRNEDGDDSGFGSHVCHAKADALSNWDCGSKSDPHRYDSPWMFRHGKDLYLIARRNPDGPFDLGETQLPFAEQKAKYLSTYSLSTKRTALYGIDQKTRAIKHIVDLPSAGDNAFPSVRRLDEHRFLVANYTSPVDKTDWTWLDGQIAKEGTQLYLLTIEFVPSQ